MVGDTVQVIIRKVIPSGCSEVKGISFMVKKSCNSYWGQKLYPLRAGVGDFQDVEMRIVFFGVLEADGLFLRSGQDDPVRTGRMKVGVRIVVIVGAVAGIA